jgi:hypothetical protein
VEQHPKYPAGHALTTIPESPVQLDSSALSSMGSRFEKPKHSASPPTFSEQ